MSRPMLLKTMEETATVETKLGALRITTTYRQHFDPFTGELFRQVKVNTKLSAGAWLTKEMVLQFQQWEASGFRGEKPDFV